ncbi:hypothetical protein FRC00_008101 [Tulasnella sp. 408]|nr:hypothetical protein FRC00_008101 [Tulasnella sp. 408]
MFAASRLSRRLPALRGIAKRSYTDSRVAGATANSREFSYVVVIRHTRSAAGLLMLFLTHFMPFALPTCAPEYRRRVNSKKEKAHEDQYIRQHEQAQLEKLRKLVRHFTALPIHAFHRRITESHLLSGQIEKQEADLANLKKQVEDQGKKVNGGSQ